MLSEEQMHQAILAILAISALLLVYHIFQMKKTEKFAGQKFPSAMEGFSAKRQLGGVGFNAAHIRTAPSMVHQQVTPDVKQDNSINGMIAKSNPDNGGMLQTITSGHIRSRSLVKSK